MKEQVPRDGSKASRGLRTGKIHATKSSATEIRRKLGVRPSEVRVATRALVVAGRSVKGRTAAVKDKANGSESGKAKKR